MQVPNIQPLSLFGVRLCRTSRLIPLSLLVFMVIQNGLGASAGKRVDLDYIYAKDDLGIETVDKYMPRSLSWSPVGHQLVYRQLTRDSGQLIVWMDASQPEKLRIWSPKFLKESIESFAKENPGHQACAPDIDLQSLRIPMPDLTGDKSEESKASDKNDKDPRVDVRWHSDKNLLILKSQNQEVILDPLNESLRAVDKLNQSIEVDGQNRAPSPNGRFEAYTRDGNIYIYDRVDDRELQLTRDGGSEDILNGSFPWVYWEELMWRSTYQAYEWSPDNSRIAYFQFDETGQDTYPITNFSPAAPDTYMMTYPKAGNVNPTVRVGVVSLSSGDTVWVDLPQLHEYLIHLMWAPDGQSFFLQGLNRAQNRLTLYRIDPFTGRGQMVLEESSDTWVNTFNMPLILDTPSRRGEFVWLSERTGYAHFYLVSDEGRRQTPLTSGDWEVLRKGFSGKQVFYDALTDRLFFSGKDQGPLEKHYYSLSLQDRNLLRLTQSPGNHNVTWSADGQYLTDRWTSTSVPRSLDLLNAQGEKLKSLATITFDHYKPYEFRQPELVEITGPDGVVFMASILKPSQFNARKKYPVVAYVYGEPAGQVVSNSFVGDWDMVLADAGFLVFRFDARGTPGRGRPWLDPVFRDQMTQPMEDWKTAVEYLKSLSYVDGDRMGVWGWSGGGTMTLNLMLRTPGLFQAGAAVAAVTDKALYDTIYTERYLQRPQDNPEGYKLSSPLHAAENLQGRLLIAHGISDDNVHVQNVYNLLTELNRHNKDYQLYLYPQKGHGIEGSDNRRHLYHRLLEFFTETLQP